MERSYQEIIKVYRLLGLPHAGRVFRGAASLHGAAATHPVHSEAVDHLIATAREHTPDGPPLYVLALGCVTNIASACCWPPTSLNASWWCGPAATPATRRTSTTASTWSRTCGPASWLLDSGVPHVYLPGYHVGAQLRLSLAEVERYVQRQRRHGEYLHQLFTHNPLWAILGIDPTQA
jgi:purine nucleosidase